MLSKIFITCWLVLAVLALSGSTERVGAQPPSESAKSAPGDSTIPTLAMLLKRAEENPEVRARDASVRAAENRVSMHSSLMNPMLMLGIENLPVGSFRFDEEPMTSKLVGITQNFPFPGKLSANRSAAQLDVTESSDERDESVNEIKRDLKLAYFELYHLRKSVMTNRAHIHTLEQLIQLAEERIAVGRASQQDVLDLQMEKAQILSQTVDEETMIKMDLANIRGMASLSTSGVAAEDSLTLVPFAFSADQLDSIAAQSRPALKAYNAQVEQGRLRRDAAELDRYPDFEVTLMYMQRDALAASGTSQASMTQSDMISARLGISLPLNYGNAKSDAISEAEAMTTMHEEEANSQKVKIRMQIEGYLARLSGLREIYGILKKDLYPLTATSVATSDANYAYGKGEVGLILRSELDLLHKQHQAFQIEADYNATIAQIEFLVGTDLVPH